MLLKRAILPLIFVPAMSAVAVAQSVPTAEGAGHPTPPTAARLTIQPHQPGTGSLIRVLVDRPADATKAGDSIVASAGELAGEPLHFTTASGGRRIALAAIPVDASDSVVARVVVDRASGVIDTLTAILHYPHRAPEATTPSRGRAAGARRLRVDPRFTKRLDSATDARIEHENELAREVGRKAHDTPQLWTYPFLRPRSSRVTSKFGSGRVFNGRVSSSHLGVDYQGAEGDPIYAANRGVVALVAEFFLAGNVVYIDHGLGVVTGYFHMSKPEVSVGDTVQRGQEIGLVGATGRVTGPHLHWSARYGALTVDPGDLLNLGAPFTAPDTLKRKAKR